jgi:hypothetical protein
MNRGGSVACFGPDRGAFPLVAAGHACYRTRSSANPQKHTAADRGAPKTVMLKMAGTTVEVAAAAERTKMRREAAEARKMRREAAKAGDKVPPPLSEDDLAHATVAKEKRNALEADEEPLKDALCGVELSLHKLTAANERAKDMARECKRLQADNADYLKRIADLTVELASSTAENKRLKHNLRVRKLTADNLKLCDIGKKHTFRVRKLTADNLKP